MKTGIKLGHHGHKDDLNRSGCGGGTGIRTPEGLSPQHAFQACALNRSATPPATPAQSVIGHRTMPRNLAGALSLINCRNADSTQFSRSLFNAKPQPASPPEINPVVGPGAAYSTG